MNLNVAITHVRNSNLDDTMKQSLALILDKALGDADIVARLEEEIRDLETGLNRAHLPLNNPFLKILKRIKNDSD